MAKETKANLKTGLNTYFPDNTSQDIDEADLRNSATDIIDSFRHVDDAIDNVSAGNLATRLAAQLAEGANISITQSGNNFTIAATDTNTDVDVSAANLATRLAAQLIGGTNVTITRSGNNFTINSTASGGSALTAQGLVDLINNSEGNVDAALDSTTNKIKLTGPTGGGGSFTWPSTALTTLAEQDEFLVQDDTDSTQKNITLANLRTVLAAGPGGNPQNHERVYWGHQDSIPDGTWETTDAQDNQDVRTAGQTFRINITGVLNGDYYYMIFPDDRLPTRIVDGVGADRTNSFTTVALADLIGTTDFTAYYRQNNGGQTLPFALTITTA